MKLNGVKINIDIIGYIQKHDISYHMVGRNAMMSCPFHKDSNPSFGIHVDTGAYRCFSGSCGARGNIANFVQKIDALPSYEAAESWLISHYGIGGKEAVTTLELVFGDEDPEDKIIYIPEDYLKQYDFRHPYLGGRGISNLWQSRFRIGYDRENHAVSMPWYYRRSRCVGIKFRSVLDKHFWVYKLSSIGPNKITWFGINHVYRRHERVVIIVESEIDALFCWQCGFPAIALGTSSVTKAQLDELKNTFVETVIIATDNDDAGRKIAADLNRKLTWISDVRQVDWRLYPDKKDVNDLTPEQLRTLVEKTSWKMLLTL